MTNISVIFCPPLADYPEQPKDQSHCELVDCPTCAKPMWLSTKKLALLRIIKANKQEMIFECYKCFTQRVLQNPGMFDDHVKLTI